MTFAVIDFETTGFVPERGDRAIEIGVVLMDGRGVIEGEWTTLLNPRRDVGATHVHGLRAADLRDAPEFEAIADQVLELVAGRAVVAHNASFDMRFMHAELARAGYPIQERPPALCSMKWSGRLVGPAKLQHACDALGISLTNAHSALADARATAALLTHLMRDARDDVEWTHDADRSRRFAWPRRYGKPQARTVVRGERANAPNAGLDAALAASWVPGVPEGEAAYLLVLERALLNRHISRSEARLLAGVAEHAGLSGANVARLHLQYIQSVAQEAVADGVVTGAEQADLFAIADALGISRADAVEALARAAEQRAAGHTSGALSLAPGDRVVFTGASSRSRGEWLAAIRRVGLASGCVTKTTKLVVASDPDSMSGKAQKARDYGIPIVDEATFARLFEAYCGAR